MEEIHYHRHHHHRHHHHGHGGASENAQQQQQQQYATTVHGTNTYENVFATQQHYQQQQQQHQLQNIGQPAVSVATESFDVPTSQTDGGVQSTSSFHSISSLDSLAEMSKYFPDAETPNSSPYGHQLGVGGQAQSATISNTRTATTANTVNAGPYIPLFGPTAAQQLPQPVRASFMAQAPPTQQGGARPSGPSQQPAGIPSYPSQVEGLSVSQAVVNDVLVDLQSKVINETLQQYQDGPEGGTFLEPLPPIYIQAPQPTIILRSDMHRLRAELNSTVRPQVIYRNPAGAQQFQQQQFQQQRFQQNTFQAPRFSAPPQSHFPSDCYSGYGNMAFANSDESKTATTSVDDEQRKEYEARLFNQAASPPFNDDNLAANVQSTLDLQGLSAASFEPRESPFLPASFPSTFDEQQQGDGKIISSASPRLNNGELGPTDSMPIQHRQDITFDIDNCIMRCFEAHRQRIARRRAARQARRMKRNKQTGRPSHQHKPDQQGYQTDGFQTFSTQRTYSSFDSSERAAWQPHSTLSSHYSDIVPDSINSSTSVRASERSYLPTDGYDYANTVQSTVLSSDAVDTQAKQAPFTSLSNVNVNATSAAEIPSTEVDYHQFTSLNAQDTYADAKAYDYGSYQTVPSGADLTQQQPPPLLKQQEQAVFDYANQLPYSSFASTDATVPGDAQHLAADYYQNQRQQTPAQFLQAQDVLSQPTNTYEYMGTGTHGQVPTYDYQNAGQESFEYPYSVQGTQQQALNYEGISSGVYVPTATDAGQAEQKQTFNYGNQTLTAADYYQQQPVAVPIAQSQEGFRPPSGTFEYTKESYLAQQPVYDYQSVDQQSSQYAYDSTDTQRLPQQDTYDYPVDVTHDYATVQTALSSTEQRHTLDYYQQQHQPPQQQQQSVPVPVPHAQLPTYDYSNTDQQPLQYPYQPESTGQQQSYDYTSVDTGTYISPEANVQQTEQKTTFDYTSQGLSSVDYFKPHPQSVPSSQAQGTFDQAAGTFDYPSATSHSQLPTYDNQNTEQQSYQYPYNVDSTEHQQPPDFASEHTGTYISPETLTHRATQKQGYDYTSQALSSSEYFQQHPASVPTSQAQRTYEQAIGGFDLSKQSFQNKEALFDYQSTDQPSSHYSYNGEDTRQQLPPQQEAFNYPSEATTVHSTSETDVQASDKKQRVDYTHPTVSSGEQFQPRPVSIPISQIYDSQPAGRRSAGTSIPTGTVEYTRKAFYSQEPVPDHSPKDTYNRQHEESESFSINDYLKRFEPESYSQQAGGQIKSSDEYHSISTTTTTQNTVQPTVDIYQPTGTVRTYDLQNYTNESIESATPHSAPPSSSTCEEDHQHLLHQTSASEQIHEPAHQSEQRSEQENSIYDTYSSLPPPPPTLAIREAQYRRGSAAANGYDFPAPPTPDRHSYQGGQHRAGRTLTSIVPSNDQTSIYSGNQPLPLTSPTSSDNRSDDDTKEDEEIFDLRECIARCYAKYRETWNQDQQRRYEEQFHDSHHSSSEKQTSGSQPTRSSAPQFNQQFIQQSDAFLTVHGGRQEHAQQHIDSDVVHCSDGWTQTAGQHSHEQTTTMTDTKQHVSPLTTREFAGDSHGPHTIEFTPSLMAQTHHIIPPIPVPTPTSHSESAKHEQQQQQMYEHTLPPLARLSFSDTDHQSNFCFSSQITPQPEKYDNTPIEKHDDDEQQQQQRYRAQSEPVSIQQDSLISNPPAPPVSAHIFDQQSRRSNSIPMIHQPEPQARLPAVRVLDNGRSYETEAVFQRQQPIIDPKTGLCLVPCPQSKKYAHLPPHLRPELFCIELPPAGSLPPVPPEPLPPPAHLQQQQQQQRFCIRCCCVPGQTLIKKVVYKQTEEEKHESHEAQYDYAAVMDQMATRISVRYGNSLMEESEPFVPGNYCEKLRVIDFPVYVSGKDDPKLTPLVPVN